MISGSLLVSASSLRGTFDCLAAAICLHGAGRARRRFFRRTIVVGVAVDFAVAVRSEAALGVRGRFFGCTIVMDVAVDLAASSSRDDATVPRGRFFGCTAVADVGREYTHYSPGICGVTRAVAVFWTPPTSRTV